MPIEVIKLTPLSPHPNEVLHNRIRDAYRQVVSLGLGLEDNSPLCRVVEVYLQMEEIERWKKEWWETLVSRKGYLSDKHWENGV